MLDMQLDEIFDICSKVIKSICDFEIKGILFAILNECLITLSIEYKIFRYLYSVSIKSIGMYVANIFVINLIYIENNINMIINYQLDVNIINIFIRELLLNWFKSQGQFFNSSIILKEGNKSYHLLFVQHKKKFKSLLINYLK